MIWQANKHKYTINWREKVERFYEKKENKNSKQKKSKSRREAAAAASAKTEIGAHKSKWLAVNSVSSSNSSGGMYYKYNQWE